MQTFEENLSAYEIISILSECFVGKATVNLAKHIRTGQMVALKLFHLDKISQDIYLIEKEIILTRQLQHPNILPYFSTFVAGPDVCVVSPLQAFGSCKSLINSHFPEGLPEIAVIYILKDVLEAICYLHKKGYIHRAIKASHILISDSGRACLTGLRYACPIIDNGKWQKQIHSFPLTTQPNLNWLSPELLEQNLKGYNQKSDIYSVGMVCCELANGKEPFSGVATTLMLIEKVRGCAPGLLDCNTIPLNSDESNCPGDYDIPMSLANRNFSKELHDFCYICLERDPDDRPTATQLLSHLVFRLLKKNFVSLPELLKPALPLSDKVAYNKEEMASIDELRHFSDLGDRKSVV